MESMATTLWPWGGKVAVGQSSTSRSYVFEISFSPALLVLLSLGLEVRTTTHVAFLEQSYSLQSVIPTTKSLILVGRAVVDSEMTFRLAESLQKIFTLVFSD